jgi:hypothetical protein
MSALFTPKKIWKVATLVVQGTLAGLGLNFFWHYFLAVTLGWGDSAPDWYFRRQGGIFIGIFFLGVAGRAIFYPRLDGYLTRKTPEPRSS